MNPPRKPAALTLTSEGRKRVLHKDGVPMMAIRPDKPEIPLRLADKAQRTNNAQLFERLCERARELGVEYALAGWLAADGSQRLLDGAGAPIDTLRPGDSFIGWTGEPS